MEERAKEPKDAENGGGGDSAGNAYRPFFRRCSTVAWMVFHAREFLPRSSKSGVMLGHVMQVTRISSLCLLALFAGCATAQSTAPLAAAPTTAAEPSRPPVASGTATNPVPRYNGDAASLDGPDGLTRLCESMRDEASLTFPGNAVEQARAYEAHMQRRQAAISGRYVTMVPATGYAFRSYELDERRLVLNSERGLVLGDGAELFLPSDVPAPGFVLGPDLADRILTQHANGKVELRLIFRPESSQLRQGGCVWLGGGRVVKLGIEVVAAALIGTEGGVLARSDTGEYADPSLAGPVRSPRVSVSKPRTADGKDLSASLAAAFRALAVKAQPCYERVLLVRPSLRGTMVLGIRIGAGGRVEAPHVEMSSLGDDAVTKCVSRGAAKATINGASAGQHFSVPLQFGSAED